MYCNGCGSTIHAGMQFCNVCGKQIVGVAGRPVPPGSSASGRVGRNVQLLAALWMVYGVLRLTWLFVFGRVIVPLAYRAMEGTSSSDVSWAVTASGWHPGSWLFPFGMRFGSILTIGLAVAYLLLGWALSQRKPWARVFGIVLGFLVLLHFPLGTALGVFTIWVLLPEESRREYGAMAKV